VDQNVEQLSARAVQSEWLFFEYRVNKSGRG
jgi:hypothetical protein